MMSQDETWKVVGVFAFMILTLILSIVDLILLFGMLVLTGLVILTFHWDSVADLDLVYVQFAIFIIPLVCLGLMFVAWAFRLVELGMWATIIGGIVFFFILALSGNGQTV